MIVPALMRFSAPVKKHWLRSFSIVLPPCGLRGFVGAGPLGAGAARGGGGARGQGREGAGGIPFWGGGGGAGTREHL